MRVAGRRDRAAPSRDGRAYAWYAPYLLHPNASLTVTSRPLKSVNANRLSSPLTPRVPFLRSLRTKTDSSAGSRASTKTRSSSGLRISTPLISTVSSASSSTSRRGRIKVRAHWPSPPSHARKCSIAPICSSNNDPVPPHPSIPARRAERVAGSLRVCATSSRGVSGTRIARTVIHLNVVSYPMIYYTP